MLQHKTKIINQLVLVLICGLLIVMCKAVDTWTFCRSAFVEIETGRGILMHSKSGVKGNAESLLFVFMR